jgi:preprotein translocase subunit SecE
MNAKAETREFRFDGLKWLLVLLLVAGAAFANSYYSDDVALLYRVLALLAVGLVACFIAVNTTKGYSFWSLMKAAQLEVRKVVWPTRKETNQTTVMVIVVVIITGIILWGLDTFLGWLASLIIG